MNPCVALGLPTGGLERSARSTAYPPAAQLEEYLACPLLMARSDPIADASLPDMRARSRPGTAMAAMMPMIATTISNSMRVNPLLARIFIATTPSLTDRDLATRVAGRKPAPPSDAVCGGVQCARATGVPKQPG